MTPSQQPTTTTITGPADTRSSISIRSGFWQGLDGVGQSVLLPREPKQFVRNGFVPNIAISLQRTQEPQNDPPTDTTGSGSLIGLSRWWQAGSTVEEALTVVATDQSTLIQLRTTLTTTNLTIEIVASVHDGDFPQIADQITDLISGIEIESGVGDRADAS